MFKQKRSISPDPTRYPRRVTVIGSGNWGSTVARLVAIRAVQDSENLYDEEVRMWVFDEQVDYHGQQRSLVDIINTHHENVKYLPGIALPANVVAEPDLQEAVKGADILIFVLPHQFLPKILSQMKDFVRDGAIAVSLIKGGFDREILPDGSSKIVLCSDLIAEALPQLKTVAVLMGGNLAIEVAKDQFCEATLGCHDLQAAAILQHLFDSEMFCVNHVRDVQGVEMCGALKNIVAIGAGFCDGLGLGMNSKSAVLRIGLEEMRKIIKFIYPDVPDQTFFESCGVGDLITTCFGGRNRRCAEAFANADGKKSWEAIESELLGGQKLQGTLTLLEIVDVLGDAPIKKEVPLFAAIYRCSFKGESLVEFVKNLNTKQMHPDHAYLVNPYELKDR